MQSFLQLFVLIFLRLQQPEALLFDAVDLLLHKTHIALMLLTLLLRPLQFPSHRLHARALSLCALCEFEVLLGEAIITVLKLLIVSLEAQ